MLDYRGTLLLVSHDRVFLNNVVTSTFVLEGDGHVGEFVGGYDDWLRQRKPREKASTGASEKSQKQSAPEPAKGKTKKLSYKVRLELDQLPQRIETLEEHLDQIQSRMADPAFYQQTGDEIASTKSDLASLETELAEAYGRWQDLEEQAGN